MPLFILLCFPMGVAWHRRAVVHMNNNGLDNRWQNLRPARAGEVVVSYNKTYAVNEEGVYAHDLIVREAYKARNRSPADAARWAEYCARGV